MGFNGEISARGGVSSGDGGLVEVSGRDDLIFRGAVDLSVADGAAGTLLLDPANITIGPGDEGSEDSELLGDNEILAGDSPGASFTISEAALESLPEDANIILEATNDITITALDNDILDLQTTTGSVAFTADADLDGAGSFTVQDSIDIETQGGDVTIQAASISDVGSLEIRTNGGDITVNSRAGEIPFGLFLFPNSSSSSNVGGNITITSQGDVFLSGRPLN